MLKLRKKVIEAELVPHLSQGSRGPKPLVGTWQIVRAILYRLKTGCQGRELPIQSLFNKPVTWESVYYHFRKWSRDGSWRQVWIALLKLNKQLLNMSSVSLDGSHTIAKQGGEMVDYQGRKRAKTTNMLFLTDSQGIPLACSSPMAGNHHDCFDILTSMEHIEKVFAETSISLDGLFMNADAGFDNHTLRDWAESKGIHANFCFNKRNAKKAHRNELYFDSLLYQQRFVVERTNAWIDSFKALIIRYEKLTQTWLSMHYLVFAVILLRKIGYKL